jgi:hypothetical protein
MKRLEEIDGAEGEIQKRVNKINDYGAYGVQNKANRDISCTLYAPRFRFPIPPTRGSIYVIGGVMLYDTKSISPLWEVKSPLGTPQ